MLPIGQLVSQASAMRSLGMIRCLQQGGDRHSEGLGDSCYIQQAYVPFGPLNAADIRTVETCPSGKIFLGPAPFLPKLPDPRPEMPKYLIHHSSVFCKRIPRVSTRL